MALGRSERRRRRGATYRVSLATTRSQQLAEGINVELSLPIFRLALAVFIPWRGADGFRPARGMAPALMVCWIEGAAGFFLFSLPPAYADPRGMKHKPDQVFEHRGGVLFLVSLPPAYADPRGMKHKPDQVFEHRGGVLFLVSLPPAYADPRGMKHKPDQVFEHRGGVLFLVSLPPAYADPRGMKHKPDQVFEHRGGVLFLVSVNHDGCPHARARPAPIPARSEADRPASAGWAALRLLADVDISF